MVPSAPRPDDTTTGSELPQLGRYAVLGKLASGGMAEILLGCVRGPSGFERPVVIKRILPQYAEEPMFVDMFLDEARIVARIRHPNVVQVQELAREGNELFLAMEYLDGETLASLQRRVHLCRERLDWPLAAYIVAELLGGLAAAHELTAPDGTKEMVVHRDVSPTNVFVTYDGRVKLIDFGIAHAEGRITKTETGVVKGKFQYMSPEQAHGAVLTPASDLFSAGILLFELSTGTRLFARRSHAASLKAVLEDPIPPPSASVADTYPSELERIVQKALDRNLAGRYASASVMRADLMKLLRTSPTEAPMDDELGQRMQRLFADRIERKRTLLAQMRDGSRVEVPSAETDEEVELPDATRATLAAPLRGSRRGLIAGLALVGAVAAALSMAFALRAPSEEPTPSAVPRLAAIQADASEVSLTLVTEPTGAEVMLDGEAVGVTPLSTRIARSEEPVVVHIALEGFAPIEESLVPSESVRMRFALEPAVRLREEVTPNAAPTRRIRHRRPVRPPARTGTPRDFTAFE